MGVTNDNLPFTLAKAENSQAFQNQFLILDRMLAAESNQTTAQARRAENEQVQESRESENREVNPDERGRRLARRGRRGRGAGGGANPDRSSRRPPGPNGEGSLLDIIV